VSPVIRLQDLDRSRASASTISGGAINRLAGALTYNAPIPRA